MDRGVLTLAALWIVLSMVAIGIGLTFPGIRIEEPPRRVADTLFFASWIGIAAIAWVAFVLANAMPLPNAARNVSPSRTDRTSLGFRSVNWRRREGVFIQRGRYDGNGEPEQS